MTANFKETIEDYKNKIEKELEVFLVKKEKDAGTYGEFGRGVAGNIKEYVLRGSAKRARGALVCVGYKAFAGEDNPEILKVACASELVHAYFLMHDDIIDRDDERRGGDAMHIVYKKLADKNNFKTESGHFGNSIAIVTGDICSSFAYEAIMGAKFSAENKLRALNRFNEMIEQTCYGQILDIVAAENARLSEKEILDIYLHKTACYTVEAPLQIGAILAGASDEQLALIGEYSRPLGMVFQLNNDLSEIFVKDEDIDCKTACDIREGKQPLFVVKALRDGNDSQRGLIKILLGKKNISVDEIKELKKVLKDTGALKYCQDFAREKISEAKKALEKIKFKNESARSLLAEFGDYLLKTSEGFC